MLSGEQGAVATQGGQPCPLPARSARCQMSGSRARCIRASLPAEMPGARRPPRSGARFPPAPRQALPGARRFPPYPALTCSWISWSRELLSMHPAGGGLRRSPAPGAGEPGRGAARAAGAVGGVALPASPALRRARERAASDGAWSRRWQRGGGGGGSGAERSRPRRSARRSAPPRSAAAARRTGTRPAPLRPPAAPAPRPETRRDEEAGTGHR